MKTHQEIWDFPWFSPSVLAQDMDQYDQPAKWMAQLKYFGFGSFLWTPGSFVLTYSTFPARYWNFCFAMWLSSGLWVISNSEWDGMGYARRNWQCIWRHSAGHQMLFHMFHPLQIGDDIAKSEFVKETERPEGAWGINRMVRVKIIYHPNWIVSYSKWNNFMDINCWRRKRYTVYGIPLLRLIAASTNGRASADSEVGKATTILWTQMHPAWLFWSRIAQKAEDSISQGASEARQRHTFYAVASPWRSWFNTIPKPCTIRLAQKSDWHLWPWTGFLDVLAI